MSNLREAAQQALEALGLWATGRDMDAVALNDLIFRLEGALAQSQRDSVDEYRKGFIAGQIDMRDREQAEPTGKDSLQVEPTVAENATTQQQIEDTPPSDYRRGYWDGFNIGKREGRIEAEDALAEPVQEPVAHKHEWFSTGAMKPGQMRCIHCGAWNHEIPPQRKPLTDEELDALAIDEDGLPNSHIEFARAIERAHGIKE